MDFALNNYRQEADRRLHSDLAEALGDDLGEILENPRVAEVDINEDGSVWVDWLGEDSGRRRFEGIAVSADEAEDMAIAIAQLSGELLDDDHDDLVTKLPLLGKTFARVSIHAPPAVAQHTICIRKHTGLASRLETLVGTMLDEDHFEALVEFQRDRANGVIAGEMFAGKTYLMNAVLAKVAEVDPDRRFGYVEVVPETVCNLKNKYGVRTSKTKSERDRIRELMTRNLNSVSNAETKSSAAVDLIDAYNTHRGGCTTTHAGTVKGALWRLETLCRQDPAYSEPPRDQIASGVQYVAVVQFRHGVGRRVTEVARILPELDRTGDYRIEYIGKRYALKDGVYQPIAA